MINSHLANGPVRSGVDVVDRTGDTRSRMHSAIRPQAIRRRHRQDKISDDRLDKLCRLLSGAPRQVSAPSKVLQVSKTAQLVSLLPGNATRPRTEKGCNCAFARSGFWLLSLAAAGGRGL